VRTQPNRDRESERNLIKYNFTIFKNIFSDDSLFDLGFFYIKLFMNVNLLDITTKNSKDSL
jgi:hypothetical protein